MKETLVEVRNAVLLFFLQESVFNAQAHLGLIDFTCEDESLKYALIEKILEELEGINMLTKVVVAGNNIWILNKHLKMYEQNVSINYSTAVAIAETVNNYCKKIKNTKEICDPSNIKERDIQKLILMLENEIEQQNTN